MFTFFFELNNKKKFLFVFLLFVVVSFFIQTIFKGLNNSCDLMWQPSKLFWEGINHYEYQLKTQDIFLGCQKGQYGHFLFIVLYPITIFDWEQAKFIWVVVNIFFAISIPIIICRFSNFSTILTCLVLGIFLTSHPTRMTINYGQNSLMMFFCIMLTYVFSNNKYQNSIPIISGISYVKYSTGYILFLSLLVDRQYKKLFLSMFLTIFGWLFYSFYTDSNLVESFFGPFKLILHGNYVRTGDLYSIMNMYFLKEVNFINKMIQVSIALILNIYFLIQIKNIKDNLAKLSVVCFLPLIFLPHSNYDYVLLLPTLIFGIKNYSLKISKYCICLVIYYFYFNRLIRHLIDSDIFYQSGMFLICVTFIIVFTNFLKNNYSKTT
jgi:hypothetical protein|tara:strand:+ start:194 stop:1330 length:1137 start_codon:yes stop_codon:yes gene_type:complete